MRKLPILLSALVLGSLAIASGLLSTASAQEPSRDRQPVFAPIESIEVVPSGSAPTGHALEIVAGLPGGCAEPGDTGFYRDGDTFHVWVLNTEPTDDETVCTKEYRTYEVTVDLGTGFVPGQQYTARVNGEPITFIAHGGIVPPQQEIAPAPIESVEISATLSIPPQYVAHIVAALPGSCAQPAGHDVWRDGTTIYIEVHNRVPAEQQICAPVYTTYPVDVNLGSDFVSGKAYTVNVNGTVETFTAY
ncbi:MAG: hypothetical protein GEU28_13015 [Dehalococcoidia bacterium]|nr:hypothetical protein [Dehalococcoidia bacterium]